MNILVTGATGFIGSHLCKELVQIGYQVFGLSRSGRTANIKSLLLQQEFHLEIGDIRDADMMRNMIKDNHIKSIFHLAAQLPSGSDINNPFLSFDTNVEFVIESIRNFYKRGYGNIV